MTFPRPSLRNFVKTLLDNGNTPDSVKIEVLASYNKWTTADAIREEFKIQQNGSLRLPEEVSASLPPIASNEEGEE